MALFLKAPSITVENPSFILTRAEPTPPEIPHSTAEIGVVGTELSGSRWSSWDGYKPGYRQSGSVSELSSRYSQVFSIMATTNALASCALNDLRIHTFIQAVPSSRAEGSERHNWYPDTSSRMSVTSMSLRLHNQSRFKLPRAKKGTCRLLGRCLRNHVV